MATQSWTSTSTSDSPAAPVAASWFAVQTKARHEKKVDTLLRGKNVDSFLPVVSKVQRWSDRKKTVEFPLFPSYSFVQIEPSPHNMINVLRTPGVLRIVSAGSEPVPVPTKQIEDVRKLLMRNVLCWEHPFLNAGQRVRVRGGCLDGVEGILTEVKSNRRLIISADPIQRSIAISIDEYDVEPA